MPGSARSASVIDSPQVGQATQAIDQRRTVGNLVRAASRRDRAGSLRSPARSAGCESANKHALMRRQPQRRADSARKSRAGPFSAAAIVVVDAAVLDVQPVKPAAVPLLVPADVIVEAVDVVGMRLGAAAGRSTLRPWP